MTSAKAFSWLHFSDIHLGMDGQVSLWPRFATILLDDLASAHQKAGGFDLLVFSGDLAQRGDAVEFDEFNEQLERILAKLGELGPRPKVVTVPGNHDLTRPDGIDPSAVALSQFWNNTALRDRMWDDRQPYLSFLSETFGNYVNWRTKSIDLGVHCEPFRDGPLPGDASYIVETAAGRLGIVGLNSTWLQLGGGDYQGELHVDARQLLATTGDDPDSWVRGNDANLLVTHQPPDWLHLDSPASWHNDINPAGRFDVHLFGHMHEPQTTSTTHGGGPAKLHMQAASLFGLETYGAGHRRIQGYSANCITIDGNVRKLTSWPRRLIEAVGGRRKLVPDATQEIDEPTGSLDIRYNVDRDRPNAIPRIEKTVEPQAGGSSAKLASADFDLSAIHLQVGEAKAHLKVRRVEQEACENALGADRIAWLVCDWGMGKDGFISAVCGRIGIPRDKVFSLDFNGFNGGETFFDDLSTRHGSTFQQICEALAEAGPALLLLDDFEVSGGSQSEAAIETLLQPVRDFASETRLLIRTRRKPGPVSFPIVELKALDEADVAIYARESELGGERFSKPDAVSTLFRHTDGVPSRLDDALRDLEIVSIGDLIAANPDFGAAAVPTSQTPPALIATVNDLAQSDDRAQVRAYNLLLALSALPRGEQLSRLTRFLGPHPFFPDHARALLERSLIDTVTITTLDGMPGDSTQKALVVPRPVREYVRSTISEDEAKSIDRKALELYFGGDWASGKIGSSPTGRRVKNALSDGYEIQNASALILRTARRAMEVDEELEIADSIRLASAFIEALITGDHFRGAVAISEDMIRLLDDTGRFASEVNVIRYGLARCCRMSGRLQEAIAEFERLDHSMLSKQQRQSSELGLALSLKRRGEDAGAAEAANRAIKIDRRSNTALQAKTIIAEGLHDVEERKTELLRLLAAAQRAKSTTVVNNIRLTLVRLETDDSIARNMLREVIQSPDGKNDFYNGVRAIVDLASRKTVGGRFSDRDRAKLIDAYHFLYNERLSSLFDRCHTALWSIFEQASEIDNLLNLFRHSSFIWRLSGQEDMEARYLAKLVARISNLLTVDSVRTSRDGAYFFVRAALVIKELKHDSRQTRRDAGDLDD